MISNLFVLKVRYETSNLSLAHLQVLEVYSTLLLLYMYIHVMTFAKQQKYNVQFSEGKYSIYIYHQSQQSVLCSIHNAIYIYKSPLRNCTDHAIGMVSLGLSLLPQVASFCVLQGVS